MILIVSITVTVNMYNVTVNIYTVTVNMYTVTVTVTSFSNVGFL